MKDRRLDQIDYKSMQIDYKSMRLESKLDAKGAVVPVETYIMFSVSSWNGKEQRNSKSDVKILSDFACGTQGVVANSQWEELFDNYLVSHGQVCGQRPLCGSHHKHIQNGQRHRSNQNQEQ